MQALIDRQRLIYVRIDWQAKAHKAEAYRRRYRHRVRQKGVVKKALPVETNN
jgi:hypothetical protein